MGVRRFPASKEDKSYRASSVQGSTYITFANNVLANAQRQCERALPETNIERGKRLLAWHWPAPQWNGWKLIKSFKATGNGPKDKQHRKKHLFKNTYKNSESKVRVCGIVPWVLTMDLNPGEELYRVTVRMQWHPVPAIFKFFRGLHSIYFYNKVYNS